MKLLWLYDIKRNRKIHFSLFVNAFCILEVLIASGGYPWLNLVVFAAFWLF